MKSAHVEESKEFHVYTAPESIESFRQRSPYMIAGGSYVFCARSVDLFEFASPEAQANTRKYKIDFVDTIHLLNVGENDE